MAQDTSAWKPVDETASAWKPVAEPSSPPDAGAQMRSSALGKIQATMPQPDSERLGNVVSGAGSALASNLNPANVGPSIVQAVKHPINTLTAGMSGFRDKAAADFSKGNYMDGVSHGIEGSIPLIGPMVGRGLDAIGTGDDKEVGRSLGDIASIKALPEISKGAGKLAKGSAAPIAETALGIRNLDRTYGKTPGEAILTDTNGVRPSTIESSAKNKLSTLNNDLETKAAASTQPASLSPAIQVLDDATKKAVSRNAGQTINQINPMRAHLTKNVVTGGNIAPIQTPAGLLQLKRGFGDEFIHNWKPDTMSGTTKTAKQAYHALDSELDRTVDGAEPLNQRISSLIPVAKRAQAVGANAGVTQQVLNKLRAPTGALAGTLAGALEGSRMHGAEGGLIGGAAGLVLPQLLASPEAEMIAARSLHAGGKALEGPAGKATGLLPLIKNNNRSRK
jgi:hypothetical protein